MTLTAFLCIFASVFLHASWNFLSKKTQPSLAFYMVMTCTAATIWLPFFCMMDFPFAELSPVFYWVLAASIAGEVLYTIGLAYAYRKGDISLVYPVVRALPVLMVAGCVWLFRLGREFTVTALIGMGVIFVGCLLMPLTGFRRKEIRIPSGSLIPFILLGAAGTTLYTILDKEALRMLGNTSAGGALLLTPAYLFLVEFGFALSLATIVVSVPELRTEFRQLKKQILTPMMAGCCSSIAYVLVLFAMRSAENAAYVQAFRQMSLPIGFLAGVLWLKEPCCPPKVIGLIFVLTGLILTALGSYN